MPVAVSTEVVPWVGAVVTVTDAGFSGAPFGVTVSFARTVVVTGVPGAVVELSATAVTVSAGTPTLTTAWEQTGVGVVESHTW